MQSFHVSKFSGIVSFISSRLLAYLHLFYLYVLHSSVRACLSPSLIIPAMFWLHLNSIGYILHLICSSNMDYWILIEVWPLANIRLLYQEILVRLRTEEWGGWRFTVTIRTRGGSYANAGTRDTNSVYVYSYFIAACVLDANSSQRVNIFSVLDRTIESVMLYKNVSGNPREPTKAHSPNLDNLQSEPTCLSALIPRWSADGRNGRGQYQILANVTGGRKRTMLVIIYGRVLSTTPTAEQN